MKFTSLTPRSIQPPNCRLHPVSSWLTAYNKSSIRLCLGKTMHETVSHQEPTPAPAVLPHLTYFNARGRAEAIRLLLEETATPYTERRLEADDWPPLKRNFIFGQLPVYEEGEHLLNQAGSIYRYLGRKHELYGDSVLEHSRCDTVQAAVLDAQASLFGLYWNPRFEQLRGEYEQQRLPKLMSALEALFQANQADTGFWVGDRLSFVDILAWYFLDCVRPFSPHTLAAHGGLWQFYQQLEQRPNIAAYLASGRRPRILTAPRCPFGGNVETS